MGEGVAPEQVLKELLCSLEQYRAIINVVLKHKGDDSVCNVSKADISRILGISPTLVSRRLKKLEEADQCVTKCGQGYRVNHENLKEFGPIARSLKYIQAVLQEPGLSELPQTIQAERLGLQKVDIQRALSYFKYGVNGK